MSLHYQTIPEYAIQLKTETTSFVKDCVKRLRLVKNLYNSLLYINIHTNQELQEIIDKIDVAIEATYFQIADMSGKDWKQERLIEYKKIEILKGIKQVFEAHKKHEHA